MLQIFFLFFLSFILLGCEVIQKHLGEPDFKEEQVVIDQTPSALPPSTPPSTQFLQKKPPNIGLILGPGGLSALSMTGVLREFHDAEIPIKAMVGLEWGALPAALYSADRNINALEWKIFRLNDRNIPNRSRFRQSFSARPIDDLNDYLELVNEKKAIESFAIPFACPTRALGSSQVIMISRGNPLSALKRCLPYPPLFYNKNFAAAPLAITEAQSFLRNQGVDYIILIHALEGNHTPLGNLFSSYSAENLIWQEIRAGMKISYPGVNQVIAFTSILTVTSLAERQRAIKESRQATRSAIRQLKNTYDF